MPVLGVPLVATVLTQKGPLGVMEMEAAVAILLARLPARSIEVNTEALSREVTRSCRHMHQHGLIAQRDGVWSIMDGQETAVQFYANSIAHYLPEGHNDADAATAKQLSAPAGS